MQHDLKPRRRQGVKGWCVRRLRGGIVKQETLKRRHTCGHVSSNKGVGIVLGQMIRGSWLS